MRKARLESPRTRRVQGWLDEIKREEGPRAALKCFLVLLEFSAPKLARTELTGKETTDPLSLQVRFVDYPAWARDL